MGGGEQVRKLGNATIIKRADENNIGSLAFPAISAGVFGFPQASCARIILEAVYRYLPGSTGIKKIVFARRRGVPAIKQGLVGERHECEHVTFNPILNFG